MLIDTVPEIIDNVEAVIVTELGSTGWHRIPTEHCFVSVEIIEKEVFIQSGDMLLPFLAKAKWTPCNPDFYRPEDASCRELKGMLVNMGMNVSASLIFQKLLHSFQNGNEHTVISF